MYPVLSAWKFSQGLLGCALEEFEAKGFVKFIPSLKGIVKRAERSSTRRNVKG
jgi:hypothetical protein